MSLVLDLGQPSTAIARAGLAPDEVEPRGLARLLFEAQQHLAAAGRRPRSVGCGGRSRSRPVIQTCSICSA